MTLITVDIGGQPVSYQTTATTIGELFNSQFREEFNIPDRGQPLVGGVSVGNDTPVTTGMSVSYQVAASSKS